MFFSKKLEVLEVDSIENVPMRLISLRLTEKQWRYARKIGRGQVSSGIRRALIEHEIINKNKK